MMDNWANWIIGPQLMGVLLLILGGIQWRFPPKKINNYYGYRSESAQKNQETWDEANHYSSVYMIKCGIALVIIGVLIALILGQLNVQVKVRVTVDVFFVIASGMAPVILMMAATEKHLSKKFDEKQQ